MEDFLEEETSEIEEWVLPTETNSRKGIAAERSEAA